MHLKKDHSNEQSVSSPIESPSVSSSTTKKNKVPPPPTESTKPVLKPKESDEAKTVTLKTNFLSQYDKNQHQLEREVKQYLLNFFLEELDANERTARR